jgi:hypothetical protein
VSQGKLGDVARALAYKFELPERRVSELCPSELIGAFTNPGRLRIDEIDALINDWHDLVQAEVQDIAARKEALNLDAKRLKYFRRRYGPHITAEHLPRGRKC